MLRADKSQLCPTGGLYLGRLPSYIRLEAALLVNARLILGALTIRTGAVPDLARGPGHTAPTYVVGSQDCLPLYGRRGFASHAWTDVLETDLALDKPAMRAKCLDRRDSLSARVRETASLQICSNLLDFLSQHNLLHHVEISAYLPIRSEVDLSSLLPRLETAGAFVSLPVVLNRTNIEFRRYHSGDALQDAGFGTKGPGADAEVVDPEVLLMPLAGFDESGARIGYGAGHYDRAIARLLQKHKTPITVGTGFAVQAVPQVPTEPHDMPLSAIVTEAGLVVPREL